ncbi:hypothetical protein [Amycolatopsis sp. NPDC004625]|uniref:hypothetical protein n=1 Tax=Amycolatopsis sp. NPDC004625 TaxID=3154670 RepID=UPI0033A01F0B
MSRLPRSAAAVLSAITLCLAASAGPAFGDDAPPSSAPTPTTTVRQPAPSVDLRLSVWFDKTAYLAQEPITVHARVTNVGSAPAQGRMTSTGDLTSTFWDPPLPPIEPGGTAESSVTGFATTESGPMTITATVLLTGDAQDANPADNTVTASVPVTHVRGSYRGTVYGDRNGNHAPDPGEALAGVRIGISGGRPETGRTTRTDAAGRFAFLDLPAGNYTTWVDTTEWYVPVSSAEVTGEHDPGVLIRGAPAAATRLSVSAAFTRSSYRVGDIAHLTLTLADKSAMVLADVTADCSASASGRVDAGDLTGPGVSLPAGSRRTFDLTVRITPQAATEGNLRVRCSVGAPPRLNGPDAVEATARVPGGIAPKVVGYVGRFLRKPQLGLPESTPLPGVKVYLRDQVTGRVVARAVTDGGGSFTFFRVPADIYDVGIVGPWQLVYTDPEFQVLAGENGIDPNHPYRHLVFVVPGPAQPDPDAVPVPAPRPRAPVPGAPAPAALATTGVGVTWLALGASLTIVIGAGLVLATRRRWR